MQQLQRLRIPHHILPRCRRNIFPQRLPKLHVPPRKRARIIPHSRLNMLIVSLQNLQRRILLPRHRRIPPIHLLRIRRQPPRAQRLHLPLQPPRRRHPEPHHPNHPQHHQPQRHHHYRISPFSFRFAHHMSASSEGISDNFRTSQREVFHQQNPKSPRGATEPALSTTLNSTLSINPVALLILCNLRSSESPNSQRSTLNPQLSTSLAHFTTVNATSCQFAAPRARPSFASSDAAAATTRN